MPAKTLSLSAAPAFVLPVLFLGYAVVANYEFVVGLGRDIAEMPKSASAYLSGEAATQIEPAALEHVHGCVGRSDLVDHSGVGPLGVVPDHHTVPFDLGRQLSGEAVPQGGHS